MMKKLLWISPYVPYDHVPHAGGKTHNYYIKYLQKSGYFDIHLVTLAQKSQVEQVDLKQYGLSHQMAVVDGGALKNGFRILYNVNSVFNSKHKLCQTILAYQYHKLKQMVKVYAGSTVPDIVIMQWTGAAFLLPVVKKLFPKAYTVVIEEDVSFLGYERRYKEETDPCRKEKYKEAYERLKVRELSLLQACDLVVVNNDKDRKILDENGISGEKIYTAAPFYEDYSDVVREEIQPKIIFYGVMSREENHKAAMWLIEHVMPLLADTGISLEIIGSSPSEELRRWEDDKITVTGYVEQVAEYFEKCLCMAVPLQLGAGIKVKILEGLSAGVPVLTNAIGIEGIPAKAGEEFYYCESPKEYVTIIRQLYASSEERKRVSIAAKQFMKDTYNIDKRLDGLIMRLRQES